MPVDDEKFDRLLSQLATGGFEATVEEREELRWHLGGEALDAKRLVHFATWLRGDSPLALRLRLPAETTLRVDGVARRAPAGCGAH